MKARLLVILVVSFFVATIFACGQKEEPAEEPQPAAVVEEEKVDIKTKGGEPEEVVEEEVIEMEGSGHKEMEGSETKEEAEEIIEEDSGEEDYGSEMEEEGGQTEE